jgi:tetratricopeptide (TPR) repeat protein
MLGERLDDLIFFPRNLVARTLEYAEEIERHSIYETIETLQRVIERDAQRPEGYLNLGLAYIAAGEWDRGIQKLRKAVNLYDDQIVMAQESQLNSQATECQRQARYHFGRALLKREQELGMAVEELRKAQSQDPDDARVYYYLGQAIRALVEKESLAEAENALQTYLDKGAPLGFEDEVWEFLNSRKQAAQPTR